MRIIKRLPLLQFAAKWPAAAGPLNEWYRLTLKANWNNFADVKRTFGQTDQARVGSGATVLIFDIGGNKFRLIAGVSDPKGKIYVLRIYTHKEYDRELWKKQL
jgi:mRNA interferase HigB